MKRLFLLVLFIPSFGWTEPATVIRATELKKDPATDAPTVIDLAENTAVDALERKGGWTRVKAGNSEGWVKMLMLRYGATGAAKAGDSGISQLFNVARSGTSGTQVTTGVRGLDAEMLANAQPNPAELKKLDGFSSTASSAGSFAASGKLGARSVEYPAP
jgi:hypothetical protein